MQLFRTKGNPTFLGEGNSAERELAALRELLPRVTATDRPRVERDIRAMEAGIAGERKVRFELANSHQPLFAIQDLYLVRGDLSAQIDFLVVTPYLSVIIECKNLYGNITIDERGSFVRGAWGRTEGIYSPVTQNERHLALMKQVRLEDLSGAKRAAVEHFFASNYKSLIVLANDETVLRDSDAPREVRDLVVRRDALARKLGQLNEEARRSGNPRSSFSEMREIAERWLGRSSEREVNVEGRYSTTDAGNNQSGRFHVPAKVSPSAEESWSQSRPAAPVCPRCGAPMVLRTATRGTYKGRNFWGCSTYPRCHCIINIR